MRPGRSPSIGPRDMRRLLDGQAGPLRGDKVAAAASELDISRAGLYRLAAQYKALGVTSSLLPARGGRPAGSRFLDVKRETIIAEEIDQFYLRPERPRLSDLCDRISARCHEVGAKPPNWRTVYSRVRDCDAKLKARRRQDTAAMARFAVVPGELVADRPLDLVQIDHTEVDVIVVDPEYRPECEAPLVDAGHRRAFPHGRWISSLPGRAFGRIRGFVPTQCGVR